MDSKQASLCMAAFRDCMKNGNDDFDKSGLTFEEYYVKVNGL